MEEERKGIMQKINEWYEKNKAFVFTVILIAFTVIVGVIISWWLNNFVMS